MADFDRTITAPLVLDGSIAVQPNVVIDAPLVLGGGIFVAQDLSQAQLVPGTVRIERNIGEVGTCSATFCGPVDELRFSAGDPVQITVGGTVLFSGTADTVRKRFARPDADFAYWQVEAVDHAHVLTRRLLNYSESSVTVGDVLSAIYAQVLAGEGMTLAASEGASTTIDTADYAWVPVFDVLQDLAEKAGGYWYITPARELYFADAEYAAAPWALSATANVREIEVANHRREYQNRAHVINQDTGNDQVYTDTAEVAARAVVEGGTGIYEYAERVSSDYGPTARLQMATARVDDHNEFGYEVTYETDENNLVVGMTQELDLPGLDVPADTYVTIATLETDEAYTDRHVWRVTARTNATASENWQQVFRSGRGGRPKYWWVTA